MNQDTNIKTDTANPNQPSQNKQPIARKKYKRTGIPWFDDPHSVVRGETALWVAVITQAMMDALSKANNSEARYHKDEAIRWLSDNSKDFVYVCTLAGLDPNYVRRKAKKALVSPVAWRAAPGKGKRYQERKAKRAAAAKRSIKSSPPSSPSQQSSNVIAGPWTK